MGEVAGAWLGKASSLAQLECQWTSDPCPVLFREGDPGLTLESAGNSVVM